MRRIDFVTNGGTGTRVLLLLGIILTGCGQSDDADEQTALVDSAGNRIAVVSDDAESNFTETGDLPALKLRGKLRIAVPESPQGTNYLPRDGSPLDWQREVAQDFARAEGLEPVIVTSGSFAGMIKALMAGRADVLAANLTVTEERQRHLSFSTPFDHAREQLVARADDPIESEEQLAGREIVVDRNTTFWETAQRLKARHPELQVRHEPLDLAELQFDRVASGDFDLTIHQSNIIQTHLPYRDDLKVAFDVSESRPLAWAMRRNGEQLRSALNAYLHREKLSGPQRVFHRDDLPGIRERRTLRVLLRNNAVSYFLYRGELVGFEYDMLKEFARQQKLRLRVVVPPTHDDLLNWLTDGRGDIAAGFLTPEERTDGSAAWSMPYHYAQQMVVGRNDEDIQTLAELAGRTIVVREASAYWKPLQRLQERVAFTLKAAPAAMETEEIMIAVEQGEFDLTVAGGPVSDLDLSQLGEVKTLVPIGGLTPSSWAVRPQNTDLKAELDRFIRREYRGLFYNVTYARYFRGVQRVRSHVETRLDPDGNRLSPYDEIVRRYGEQYDMDWRLIVSQMYQESRFNPNTRSWAGAQGLMQVMPRTARSLGFRDVIDPESGIHAGVKYMRWLHDRFDDDLPYSDRIWFTLASYNAGLGHVQDARRLAVQHGLDPNKWFGNVETAMLLLSKPQYYRKSRHGFVRGREPVAYVRKIRDRYEAYLRHTQDTPAAGELRTG